MNLKDLYLGDVVQYDVTYPGRVASSYLYLVIDVTDLCVVCINLKTYKKFTFAKPSDDDLERPWIKKLISATDHAYCT